MFYLLHILFPDAPSKSLGPDMVDISEMDSIQAMEKEMIFCNCLTQNLARIVSLKPAGERPFNPNISLQTNLCTEN